MNLSLNAEIEFNSSDDMLNHFSDKLKFNGSKVRHYTSVESFSKIIESSSFFAGHTGLMNDPMDGREFYFTFLFIIRKCIKDAQFLSILDQELYNSLPDYEDFFSRSYMATVPELDTDSQKELLEFAQNLMLTEREAGKYSEGAYFISFIDSSRGDSINLWRSYGDDGYGVGIEFSTEIFVRNPDDSSGMGFFYFCAYPNQAEIVSFSVKLLNLILQDLRQYPISDFHFKWIETQKRICKMSSIIKALEYLEESEVRFLVSKEICSSRRPKFIPRKSVISRYLPIHFSLASVNGIILGPRNHPKMPEMMTEYLMEHKIPPPIEVSASHELKLEDANKTWKLIHPSKVRYIGKIF